MGKGKVDPPLKEPFFLSSFLPLPFHAPQVLSLSLARFLARSLSTYLHDILVDHSEIAFLISCVAGEEGREDGMEKERKEGACSLP